MRNNLFIIGMFIMVCLTSCLNELDNYDSPNATLTGKVIDAVTKEPLRTEQPNGFRIRYKEKSPQYPNAQNYFFWGKADGSFNNSKIFSGVYEVQVQEGPFLTPEPKEITIEGKTELNFEVIPYLVLSQESVELEGDILHVSFKLERPSQVKAAPKMAFVAISWNPNVSYNTNGSSGMLKTCNINESNLNSEITFDIDISSLSKGHEWYVRMGACTKDRGDRFNYSEILQFNY